MGRKKKLVERAATINLVGVNGIKPCINDIIGVVASRIESESLKKSLKSSSCNRTLLRLCNDDYWDNFSVFGKKKSKQNKKRYRSLDLFPMDDDDYIMEGYSDNDLIGSTAEDIVMNGYKSIIFYSDITNELSYKEFHSLKEFNDYCDRENIYVPRADAGNLSYWSEVHCCLDPGDLEYGEKTLVTDRNYDVLYWSVMSDYSFIESSSAEASRVKKS